MASVAFMLLPFLPANAFELDLRTARIEANAVNESQKRAIKELEKHLSMIASARAPSPKSEPAVFVLGRPAPGCAEAGEHEAKVNFVVLSAIPSAGSAFFLKLMSDLMSVFRCKAGRAAFKALRPCRHVFPY